MTRMASGYRLQASALVLMAALASIPLRAQLGPPRAEVTPILDTTAVKPGSTVHGALQYICPRVTTPTRTSLAIRI